jgi:aspartate/methionine/tyrosine aminotransferase
MERLINFCIDEGLVLFADEVYQENIWREDQKCVHCVFRFVNANSIVQVLIL